ncbi:MAG: adenylosuccinate lyase, partial [Flavobacteriales bacterium]|nr:adenylosuccinate lyase [Flavobacteriales bacterium]
MELTPLTAVSPVDGRYRRSTEALGAYFSEFALIRYRLHVEVEYFIALCEIPLPQLAGFDTSVHERMRKLVSGLTVQQAQAVKDIEKVTNHDVKAVEYFLKQEMESWGVGAEREFVHFGLTSQDINNTAVPLSIKEGIDEIIEPLFDKLIKKLSSMAEEWKDVSMLARTHGQPASPTRLGKEVRVFVERLRLQWEAASAVPHAAKFGGATGNLNAHCVAYPDQDWNVFANKFIEEGLGLTRSFPTTQIEHYDQLGARFDALKRVSVICIDLCRDMWTYISMEYFRQKIKEGEVGSSAMPHKVNPIDFENAEGNLGIAI